MHRTVLGVPLVAHKKFRFAFVAAVMLALGVSVDALSGTVLR